MIITQQLSISTAKLKEIVDINVRLNYAVRQQFSRTLSGVALSFQGLDNYFKFGHHECLYCK